MNAQFRRITTVAGLMAVLLGSASCGKTYGKSGSFLVIDLLEGSSGAQASEFSGTLASDVVTNVSGTDASGNASLNPTLFEDLGQVQLRMVLRDIGAPASPPSPSTLMPITVTRYHVAYRRSDGRNVQGVDVPYAFDGAVTATISNTPVQFTFTLVRIQAKLEAPLMALCSSAPACTPTASAGLGGAGAISTIAEVTFYGRDLAGNTTMISGAISVNFADWGDPS